MEPLRQTASHLLGIQQQLIDREPIYHRPEHGTTRAALEAMTSEAFWEVGASGQRYSRDYVIDLVAKRFTEAHEDDWRTESFYCREIAEDNYLLSYSLHQGPRVTRRATLWRRSGDGWLIIYHQGTIVEKR